MASFLAVDAVVTRSFDVDQVAFWAFAKSTILLASTICIYGLDQVIVRHPAALRVISRHLAARCIISAAVISVFLALVSTSAGFVFWFSVVSLSALLSIYFAVLRGAYLMTMAQFSLNGWKLLLLLLVLGSRYWIPSASMGWILFIALVLSSLVVVGYSFFTKKWKAYYIERERSETIPEKGLMVKEAGYFFLLGLSLTASINLEQLALNFLGLKKESALLLAHFSIFIPLIVFLNGFIGFYLGPFMRVASKRINFQGFKKANSLYALAGLMVSIFSYCFGCIAFDMFFNGRYEISYGLAVLLTALGFARFLYTVPSSYIGVISKSSELKRYSVVNLYFVGFSVIFFFVLMAVGISAEKSILISSLANWILRVGLGYWLVYRDLRVTNV